MIGILSLLAMICLIGCATERDTNPVNPIDFGWGIITTNK